MRRLLLEDEGFGRKQAPESEGEFAEDCRAVPGQRSFSTPSTRLEPSVMANAEQPEAADLSSLRAGGSKCGSSIVLVGVRRIAGRRKMAFRPDSLPLLSSLAVGFFFALLPLHEAVSQPADLAEGWEVVGEGDGFFRQDEAWGALGSSVGSSGGGSSLSAKTLSVLPVYDSTMIGGGGAMNRSWHLSRGNLPGRRYKVPAGGIGARQDSERVQPGEAGAEVFEEGEGLRHRFFLLARSSLALHLSDARTMGGLGGGLGLRDVVGDYFVAQADAAWLSQLGNVLALRVGAGVQKPGTWSPAALLAVNAMFGSQLLFPDVDRPALPGPVFSFGLVLAPLRFSAGGAEISLFELGIGIGAESPGFGTSFSLGFDIGAQIF